MWQVETTKENLRYKNVRKKTKSSHETLAEWKNSHHHTRTTHGNSGYLIEIVFFIAFNDINYNCFMLFPSHYPPILINFNDIHYYVSMKILKTIEGYHKN